MNTMTKLTILTTLLIAFLFQAVTPAFADNRLFSGVDSLGNVHKVNNHVTPKSLKSCTTEGAPQLSDYMGDGTPDDVAYSDYLEDLAHWHYWTAGECNIAPETLQ